MGLLKVFAEEGRASSYSMLKSIGKSQPCIPLYEQVEIRPNIEGLTCSVIAEVYVSAL
jgi:hypothetical protein